MAEMAESQEDRGVAAATIKTEIAPTLERGGIREARPLTAVPSPGRGRHMSTASGSSRHSLL